MVIAGHKTSMSLEDEFYAVLKEIAKERGITAAALVNEIDRLKEFDNLSSACRIYVLAYCRSLCAAESEGRQLTAGASS